MYRGIKAAVILGGGGVRGGAVWGPLLPRVQFAPARVLMALPCSKIDITFFTLPHAPYIRTHT